MGEQQRWKRALVTGASSGIGEACARQLGAAGTDLVLVARSRDRLDSLAEEIRARSGVTVEVLAADLGERGPLAAVEARIAAVDDPVDLLVNNAGFGVNGSFVDHSADDAEAVVRVNAVAVMRLAHAAARAFPDRGGGAILNVSSLGAFQPAPGTANYAATKAYVTSLSQALHEELKGTGVTVTALHPGFTRTEFQERGGYRDGLPDLLWQSADEVARSGLDAAATGDPVRVPGWHNKVAATARVLPMAVQRFAAAQVTRRLS
jgi:uncharacterized protein